MRRRSVLAGGLAAAALARPQLSRATGQKVLKFIAEGDLPSLDPVWTTATVVRNHGYLVFDTLYGQDGDYKAQPQMVAGHTVENDGRTWTLTLRDGLRFHDNEPVRAQDVVPSIRRFAARDAFGAALLDATDELSVVDDKRVRFRLKRPFPLLPDALGKSGTGMPCIMPERLANTDPSRAVTEAIGSGPFRYVAGERVPGARVVYERFAGYVPRADGPDTLTAGPKRPLLDRVEWQIIPDAATASSALLNGEVQWWQNAVPDLLDLLRQNHDIAVTKSEPAGNIAVLRFNFLHPPFDNVAIRRAVLRAVDQTEFMTAVAGDDHSLWRDRVGCFPPDTPMATDLGTASLIGPRDLEKIKRDIREAGYKGERVVLLDPTDYNTTHPAALVTADLFRKIGLNVDLVSTDWGTLVQRRTSRNTVDQGGWSVFPTYLTGANILIPTTHLGLRGDGGWFGWAKLPKLEALQAAWLAAPDQAAQKRVAEQIQAETWDEVPFVPLGVLYQSTAYSKRLRGIREGFPIFWGVEMA